MSKVSKVGKSKTNFDNIKDNGSYIGKERKWGYRIIFRESLRCQNKVLGPQIAFI